MADEKSNRTHIWVTGSPRPKKKSTGPTSRYRAQIRNAARKQYSSPLTSDRIHVQVYWMAEAGVRPDVDNVLKPVLDALEGIVYLDDRQVTTVSAGCLPSEAEILDEPRVKFLRRLEREFLIVVTDGYNNDYERYLFSRFEAGERIN